MRYGAEREIAKIEENVAKSRDLAPESKSRLRLEIDSLKVRCVDALLNWKPGY